MDYTQSRIFSDNESSSNLSPKVTTEEFEVGGTEGNHSKQQNGNTAQLLKKGLAEKEACLFPGINPLVK